MPITERDLRVRFASAGATRNNYYARDILRSRIARERALAAGASAMEAALAAFDACFSPGIRHRTFKARVAGLMKKGPHHFDVWSRYQQLAERYFDADLPAALALIDQKRAEEIRLRDEAVRLWGRVAHPRLNLMLLDELRLMLRWLSRYAPHRLDELRRAVIAGDDAQVAEAAE